MSSETTHEVIRIKYASSDLIPIKAQPDGDWFDLRVAEDITLKKGEFKLIPLGVAMELPRGYEAHVVPRSSTYKNFKIIQTNHQGVIDNSYCGDGDWWFFPALAMEDTEIHKNDRICQFRIVRKQPEIEFNQVTVLGNDDRGGHGHSGIR